MKKSKLEQAWEKYLKLCVEGDKFYDKGEKFWAEGNKLWAKADKMWRNAVREVHGDIKIEWEEGDCHLETGKVFKVD